MKKKIIPSLSLAFQGILSGLFIPLWITGIYVIAVKLPFLISNCFKDINAFNIFISFGSILVITECIVILGLSIYNFIELCLFAGRPIKFSGNMICQGYLKIKKYYKKDVTGIGIAPTVYGNKFKNFESKTLGIYITFGNYKRSDLGEYGILTVWEVAEFCGIWPSAVNFTNRICAKIGLPDCSKIQPFDGLVWMTYTEENMRFLKEWMGDRFEEVV